MDRYLHGASIFIRDVLQHFDLPQVAASIAGRDLTLLSPVDHMKRPVEVALAEKAYRFTQEAYATAGAEGRFRVLAETFRGY